MSRQSASAKYRKSGEHGSALVEFAISCSIVFALMFGVIASCLAIYTYHSIADAAREGTRYAIVRGSSCSTYGKLGAPCPVTTSAQIQTYVRSLTLPGIDSTLLNVNASWPTTGASCTPSSTPCNNPGNLVRVTVSYQLPLTIPFVAPQSLNLRSTSQMVIAD